MLRAQLLSRTSAISAKQTAAIVAEMNAYLVQCVVNLSGKSDILEKVIKNLNTTFCGNSGRKATPSFQNVEQFVASRDRVTFVAKLTSFSKTLAQAVS